MSHRRSDSTKVAVVLILISTAFLTVVIPAPAHASSIQLTGKYIMAFLACNTSTSTCSSPQNHVTHLAESNDSVSWSQVPVFTPYPGSVPDAIRRGNTIYIYNPGMLVRFHLDTGTQSQPTTVSLKFDNGTSATFVDPSVFLDSNGTLHLFYLPGITGQDPAQCPAGQSTCTKRIMSATETSGTDGGSFIVDSGTRVSYTISQCCFSDPAVFQGPGGYYLYVSDGQAVIAFDSPTLKGSYATVQGLNAGLLVPFGAGGVPAGYYDNSSSSYWTFITQGRTVQLIARASTASISSQISNSSFSTILSGCNFPGLGCSYTVGSPGFHLNTAGPTLNTSTSTTASTTSTSSSLTSSTTTSSRTTSTTSATSSRTSSSSSTTTLSATSSTQSQTSSAATSRVTSSPSITTSTSISSRQSTSATTTTAAGGGGIPEFPYRPLATMILISLVAASYLLARRRKPPDRLASSTPCSRNGRYPA